MGGADAVLGCASVAGAQSEQAASPHAEACPSNHPDVHDPPQIPLDEEARLRVLRSLQILDTDPEERFDRHTRLARRVFGTKTALVSLVDQNRQWFKSRQGLDACQTDRDISFCGHAVANRKPLVIEDATQDPRFFDNPLVTGEPRIRF